MLQHNTAQAGTAGRRAHIAHAAMLAFHMLCCGLPILALAITAAMGASSGLLAFSSLADGAHALIHSQEALVLVVSGALLILGAALEWSARASRGGRLPWLLVLSAGCFLFNVVLVSAHQFA